MKVYLMMKRSLAVNNTNGKDGIFKNYEGGRRSVRAAGLTRGGDPHFQSPKLVRDSGLCVTKEGAF